MKKLTVIALVILVLVSACGEKEKPKHPEWRPAASASGIMPDSALLQVDTVHLYALRDSNLALYQRSNRQKDFQQAVQYNAQYRLYNDSILQVQRAHEIARVRANYDREKLTGEQYALTLDKTKAQTTRMIVLLVCLALGGLLLLLYQHRLIRKERGIRQAKSRSWKLTEQIALNRLAIRANEEMIQIISEQLEPHSGLEEQLNEQQADIERIREANTRLQRDNEELENEVKKYSSLSQYAETEHLEIDRLVEDNRIIQEQDKHFTDLFTLQLELIGQLKESPFVITPEETEQVINETDEVYPGFTGSFRRMFPNLSGLDLLTCCLIKLKFKTSEIARIMQVDIPSVSKRKLRMKSRMQELIPDIWEDGGSLDVYIYKWVVEK